MPPVGREHDGDGGAAVSADAIVAEELYRLLEEARKSAKRSPWYIGTVVSHDATAGTVQLDIPQASVPDVQVSSSMVPKAGTPVVVLMNGKAPLVVPLPGASVAINGTTMESPDYVAGVSGWIIRADGSAEFNNVIVRGVLAAAVIDRLAATDFQIASSLIGGLVVPPNLTFDTNATGWSGFLNCTVGQVGSPVKAGTGALAITVTGAGAWEVRTPSGTNGFAAIPGAQYQVTYWARTAATVRNVRMYIRFYKADGSLITTWHSGDEGDTIGLTETTSYATRTSRGTAPPNAATYGLAFAGTNGAAAEVHYLDEISIDIAPGYCADANYLGAAFDESLNSSAGSLPNGYVGTETNGASSTSRGAFTYANLGGTKTAVPNQAYSVEVDAIMASVTAAVRTFVAWYSAAGAFLRADYGPIFYTDSVLTPSPPISGEFNAPAGTAFMFAGVGSYGGITDVSAAHTISVGTISVYETTNINSGYLAPEVMFSGSDIVPPGSVMAYAGAIANVSGTNGVEQVIPGWLIADGRAVSRTRWPELFAAIGTFYGAGDGSTTFNLPDLRGRVILASDGQGGTLANRINTYASALGTTGGSELLGQTLVGSGVAVVADTAADNMPPFITMYYIIKT